MILLEVQKKKIPVGLELLAKWLCLCGLRVNSIPNDQYQMTNF